MRLVSILILLMALGHCNQANAQITLTQIETLSFGSMTVDPAGDEIRVRPNGRITARNATILEGGESRGRFQIEGPSRASVTYSISDNNTLSNGSQTISLHTFQTNRNNPFTLNRRGRRKINIGARITIPPNLQGGSYVGSYILTVENQ